MSCCIGDCCVMNCGFCCIGDFFSCKDCSNCCVGDTPAPPKAPPHPKAPKESPRNISPRSGTNSNSGSSDKPSPRNSPSGTGSSTSKTISHADKIANELAAMMKRKEKNAAEEEKRIIDDINSSMEKFISELEVINREKFNGRELNINIASIRHQNELLKKEVIGCIGDRLHDRLVLTDSELKVILQEQNDEKRRKNFEAFCNKIQKDAVNKLKVKIKEIVAEQQEIVHDEINNRLNEVKDSMQKSYETYQKIVESNDTEVLEETKIKYMYQSDLCETIQRQIGDDK